MLAHSCRVSPNDDKQIQAIVQRILAQAGWKLGGASVAEYLGVSDATLAEWLTGKSVPPAQIIQRVVALIETKPTLDGSRSDPNAGPLTPDEATG